jgi:hypothetical protein
VVPFFSVARSSLQKTRRAQLIVLAQSDPIILISIRSQFCLPMLAGTIISMFLYRETSQRGNELEIFAVHK